LDDGQAWPSQLSVVLLPAERGTLPGIRSDAACGLHANELELTASYWFNRDRLQGFCKHPGLWVLEFRAKQGTWRIIRPRMEARLPRPRPKRQARGASTGWAAGSGAL
jgi:hypothetical protein